MNEFNQRIKKCCASCAFKQIVGYDARHCTLLEQDVNKGDVCERWQMSEAMRTLRQGRPGRVVKPEWVRYLMDNINEFIESNKRDGGALFAELPDHFTAANITAIMGEKYPCPEILKQWRDKGLCEWTGSRWKKSTVLSTSVHLRQQFELQYGSIYLTK